MPREGSPPRHEDHQRFLTGVAFVLSVVYLSASVGRVRSGSGRTTRHAGEDAADVPALCDDVARCASRGPCLLDARHREVLHMRMLRLVMAACVTTGLTMAVGAEEQGQAPAPGG